MDLIRQTNCKQKILKQQFLCLIIHFNFEVGSKHYHNWTVSAFKREHKWSFFNREARCRIIQGLSKDYVEFFKREAGRRIKEKIVEGHCRAFSKENLFKGLCRVLFKEDVDVELCRVITHVVRSLFLMETKSFVCGRAAHQTPHNSVPYYVSPAHYAGGWRWSTRAGWNTI